MNNFATAQNLPLKTIVLLCCILRSYFHTQNLSIQVSMVDSTRSIKRTASCVAICWCDITTYVVCSGGRPADRCGLVAGSRAAPTSWWTAATASGRAASSLYCITLSLRRVSVLSHKLLYHHFAH